MTKPALTPRQSKVLAKIKEGRFTQDGFTYVHGYVKGSWEKRGKHFGPELCHLEMLEKKGYIELKRSSHNEVGVFNPKEQSWGYSQYSEEYFAKIL